MTDESLTRLMRDAATTELRDGFLDELHDQLAIELGLGTRRTAGPAPLDQLARGQVRPRLGRSGQPGGRRGGLLLVAAILLGSSALAMIAGGLATRPGPDLLQRVTEAGLLRVGIVAGPPQARYPDGILLGIDVDLAELIGGELGVRVEAVELLSSPESPDASAWDVVILPMGDAHAGTSVISGAPMLHLPVDVLVAEESTSMTIEGLTGMRVCTVEGSPGSRWLAGERLPPEIEVAAVPPSGVQSLTATSDADCLVSLETGAADAFVTETLGPADLRTRPWLRSLAGPVLSVARVVSADADGPDPAALLSAVDRLIDRMRTDGTLTDLSRRRLGADLTQSLIPPTADPIGGPDASPP